MTGLETENDIKEQEAEGKVHGGTERFVGDHRGSCAVSSDVARQPALLQAFHRGDTVILL
ncbi:MAG: hypothetical protein QOH39_2540 [Verrucomicrobiota bacterium]|jgi:hypothetical protein